ncbi:tetratricopeptide repeat protein [candidate division KSB1 bacterium]|nr:tetratricopeptide repeat protein [candidate division KSB1 bacterium]
MIPFRRRFFVTFPQILSFVLLISLLFSGCAYYNTFYNAKKFYAEADKERKKRMRTQIVELSPEEKERLKRAGQYNSLDNSRPTGEEMQNYQRAIEKASRVLEFYPNSRYVDDALMLLGKCFFFRREYNKAMRKFDELQQLYPESEFVEESRLLAARTLIGLGEFDQAESRFRDLTLDSHVNGRIREEAAYELGGLYFEKENYELAAREYEKAAKESDDKLIRAMALYRLGECYLQLKRTEEAEQVLRRAVKASPNEDFKSQATYKLGEAQSLNENYEKAVKTFSDLLEKEMEVKRIPMIKLQLAENLRHVDRLQEAVNWYNNIIEEHKRTDASARSYFALAELEEFVNLDYKKAQEYYELVRGEFQTSAIAPIAKERADDIKKLLELLEDIARLEGKTGADSLSASTKEVEGEREERDDAPIDLSPDGMWVNYSGRDRPPPLSLKRMSESDRQRARNLEGSQALLTGDESGAGEDAPDEEEEQKRQVVEKKLALAELLLFKFNKQDSSVDLFLTVLENTQDSVIAARTLYALGYTFDAVVKNRFLADSIFHRLVDLYPHSPQAEGARRLLRLPLLADQADSAKILFHRAEKLYLKEDQYEEALDLLERIRRNYPQSDYASKAFYATGWIYENRLYDNEAALMTYKNLVQELPDSPYAKQVKTKLDAVENERRNEEERRQAVADSLTRLESAARDSSAIDSLQIIPVVADSLIDSTGVSSAIPDSGSLPFQPAVVDTAAKLLEGMIPGALEPPKPSSDPSSGEPKESPAAGEQPPETRDDPL